MTWIDISVEKFMELRDVENTSFDSYIDKIIEVLSILHDVDPTELEEKSTVDLISEFKKVNFIYTSPSKDFKKEIEGYKFKEFDSLTLAEYIDLTHFFSSDYFNNLTNICSILYRKEKVNEWGHTIVEPYNYSPFERSSMFNNISINDIYGIIPAFESWKKTFEENYAPLFEPEFEKDEDYEPSEEDEKEDKLEEDKKRFSWERFIYGLCDGDLTKSDAVLELGLIYVFNMLSMKKTFGD